MSVLVAGALDAWVGEPPARAHPVVWVGRFLDHAAGYVPASPPRIALVRGGAAWGAGAVLAVATGVATERAIRRLPPVAQPLVRGTALWPLLSARMLLDEVAAVERAAIHDLETARAAVSRIVSRDTGDLDAVEVRSAAIESLAENLADSVVAPLAWYVAGGLPAVALHRYANTADACWGYRSPRWEHAGRVAARADDLLNLVAARLTALLLVGYHPQLGAQAGRTSSPNAGWPMAAMALRLDIRLAKRGHHELNADGRAPTPADTAAALRAATAAVGLAIALAALLESVGLHTTTRRRSRGGRA